MNNNYQKGNILEVCFRKTNSKEILNVVGFVIKINKKIITLGYNFIETSPVDSISIPTKNIKDIKIVVPKDLK